ncbi:MAG: flagellar M-ring protein [Fimbriimonadales bacterium]|nr:MAG: flagellar M-ring protein [Fimbriimonadales bacterium]
MGGTLLKLRTWWQTADQTTKTVTLVGGGLLVTLLFGIFYLSSRPSMDLLFPRLEPSEQGRVIQKLQERKIPYEQRTDGSIYVASNRLAETRAMLAMEGIPSSASAGMMWLNDLSFTDPQSLQDEKLRLALETSMRETIEYMEPVISAQVHIAPGENSPFVGERSEPSASVLVQLRPGADRTAVAEAIVATLTGGVRNLSASNIQVTDSKGEVLWDGKGEQGVTAIASRKRQAEIAQAERYKRDLEEMIARVAGPGKAVVNVEVEMNFDRQDVVKTAEKGLPQPVSETAVREVMGANAVSVAAGAAGGAQGGQQPPAQGAPGSREYGSSQEVKNYGLERTQTETSVAPGRVVAARVSITLDEEAASVRQAVEEHAKTLIGADGQDQNFKVTVSTAPFDKTAAAEAQKALAAAKSEAMKQQIISLIPVIALVIVGFLVVKAIGKAAKTNANVLLTAAAVQAGAGGGAALPAGAAAVSAAPSAGGEAAPSAPAQVENKEPELSEAAKRRVEDLRRSMAQDVEAIPEKFDRNLAQILLLADERPESVALLVKSWLLEEVN